MIELNKWYNEFIWCPSQCYYFFKRKNKLHCIYLRWRWDDPWSISLITFQDDKLPDNYWDADFSNAIWESIDLGYFTDNEIGKLQEKAVKKLVKINIFSKIQRIWKKIIYIK